MQIKKLRTLKQYDFLFLMGGTMFNDLTSYDMYDMYFRHVDDREATKKDLEKMGVKKHHQLENWMTPIEREEMLKECLTRLVFRDIEAKENKALECYFEEEFDEKELYGVG